MSGSSQWCMEHWAIVRDGDYNGILATMHLMDAFINSTVVAKLKKRDAKSMSVALDKVAPLCCWIGEKRLAKILEQSKREQGEAK